MGVEYDEHGNITAVINDHQVLTDAARKRVLGQANVTLRQQDRAEMVAAMILKVSFSVGLGAFTLSVFFALIYTFLRWVLA